jgi:hypothetical protein
MPNRAVQVSSRLNRVVVLMDAAVIRAGNVFSKITGYPCLVAHDVQGHNSSADGSGLHTQNHPAQVLRTKGLS